MIPHKDYDKITLFDGTGLSSWTTEDGNPADWELEDDFMKVNNQDNIFSKEKFQDAYIHLEFRIPYMPEAKGQKRGNSGIFLQDNYEIQVLDSYGINKPGTGDCGAIYKMYAPLANACKPPLEWQTYDIIFRAPRFDADGELVEKPRVTVFLNQILIQNNVEIYSPTRKSQQIESNTGPLMLQSHGPVGDRVSYRNIWLAHIPQKGSEDYEPS